MANTQAMCTSFKKELLTGTHIIGTHVFKIALYNANAAGLSEATTAYAATINSATEVVSTNYTAGGQTVTLLAPANTGTTVYTGPTSGTQISWGPSFSATGFDCALIYNSTQAGKAVSVHTFGSQTITSGTFTITFPTNDATTGLLKLS